MNRDQIQKKIDSILKNNPKIKLEDIKDQLSAWMDQSDLSTPISQDKVALVNSVNAIETATQLNTASGDTLSHDFMKNRILDDLLSYEGVTE